MGDHEKGMLSKGWRMEFQAQSHKRQCAQNSIKAF